MRIRITISTWCLVALIAFLCIRNNVGIAASNIHSISDTALLLHSESHKNSLELTNKTNPTGENKQHHINNVSSPRKLSNLLTLRRMSLWKANASHPPSSSSLFQKACQSITTGSIPAKTTIKLLAYYFLLYFFTVLYNLANKKVLSLVPLPASITAIQMAIGIGCFLPFWLWSHPKFSIVHHLLYNRALWWIAMYHGLGNLATVYALQDGSVSFVHVIKAAEPIFAAILSILCMRQTIRIPVLLSLLPIVCGVGIASMQEIQFSWWVFLTAMLSNYCYQYRMILSKLSFQDSSTSTTSSTTATSPIESDKLSATNTFRLLTILSAIQLLLLAYLLEGTTIFPILFPPQSLTSTSTTTSTTYLTLPEQKVFLTQLLLSGISFYWYNEISYWILALVHPITHAVGNTIKRIVLILCSILLLHIPITGIGLVGAILAIGGSFVYAYVSQSSSTTTNTTTISTTASSPITSATTTTSASMGNSQEDMITYSNVSTTNLAHRHHHSSSTHAYTGGNTTTSPHPTTPTTTASMPIPVSATDISPTYVMIEAPTDHILSLSTSTSTLPYPPLPNTTNTTTTPHLLLTSPTGITTPVPPPVPHYSESTPSHPSPTLSTTSTGLSPIFPHINSTTARNVTTTPPPPQEK